MKSGGDEGYACMLSEILPHMIMLVEDEKTEVRFAATTAFVSLAHMVHKEDLSQYVLTVVLVGFSTPLTSQFTRL